MMRVSATPSAVLFGAKKPAETSEQAVARQALKYAQDKTILTFQTGPTETKTWNLHQALTWVKSSFPTLPVELGKFQKFLRDQLLLPANQASRVIDLMGQNPSFFNPGQSGMRAQRLAGSYLEELPRKPGGNFFDWKDVFGITDLGLAVTSTPTDNADPTPMAKAAQAYSDQLAQKLPTETQLAQSITLASPKAEALGKKGTLVWRAHDQLGLMGQLLEKSKKFDSQTRPGVSMNDITTALKKLAKFSTDDITKVINGSLQAHNGAWVQQTTIAKRAHYTLTPQGWLLAKNAPNHLFQ